MNILLCGFMGAGKSTFLQRFKENDLGYLTFDLDCEVAKSLGIKASEIGDFIRSHTLEDFRKEEIKTLMRLVNERTNKLIALGGGTLENSQFWNLRDRVKMIYLEATFDDCFSRIKNDPNRALVELGLEYLKNLYEQRVILYEKSDLILTKSDIKEIDALSTLVHNVQEPIKPTRG